MCCAALLWHALTGYWDRRVYDESVHVHLGPGALRGLSWLFAEADKHTPMEKLRHLEHIQEGMFTRVGVCADTLFHHQLPARATPLLHDGTLGQVAGGWVSRGFCELRRPRAPMGCGCGEAHGIKTRT